MTVFSPGRTISHFDVLHRYLLRLESQPFQIKEVFLCVRERFSGKVFSLRTDFYSACTCTRLRFVFSRQRSLLRLCDGTSLLLGPHETADRGQASRAQCAPDLRAGIFEAAVSSCANPWTVSRDRVRLQRQRREAGRMLIPSSLVQGQIPEEMKHVRFVSELSCVRNKNPHMYAEIDQIGTKGCLEHGKQCHTNIIFSPHTAAWSGVDWGTFSTGRRPVLPVDVGPALELSGENYLLWGQFNV